MEWISNPEVWTALATLTFLEIVLGVDNVIFISILANKLPVEQQAKARRVGILGAAGMRIFFLLLAGWIVQLKVDVFSIGSLGFSWKDVILIVGGLFLIFKATREIHHRLEGVTTAHGTTKAVTTFRSVIIQILLLDLVFSIDSVITAIGMTEYISVMVIAVMVSVVIMLLASKLIYEFVNEHPTVKILALSFLLLIGMTLIAEGMGEKIPKGFVYSAILFSVFVEALNLRIAKRKGTKALSLHEPYLEKHNLEAPTPKQPTP